MRRLKDMLISGGLLLALAGGAVGSAARAQTDAPGAGDPPCEYVVIPYRDVNRTCIELVYDEVQPAEGAPELSSLAFAPDGTLYFLRTARGEVWALRDTDGDRFPDDAARVAEGLRLPTGLAYHDGALYVADVDGITRIDDPGGDPTTRTLVDGWDLREGFWAGGIGVGPDGRIYAGIGADCDACPALGERRGVLVSYAPDGGDERIEATGLRYPADLVWDPATGDLWLLDQGRAIPGLVQGQPPGELNRFVPGTDYGHPYCYGGQQADPALTQPTADHCWSTHRPEALFPYQSNPTGAAFYTGDAFPEWEGDLIVALNGSWNLPEPAGYAVVVSDFDAGQPTGAVSYVAPASDRPETFSLEQFSLMGRGFYPFHPADVAVSAEGWIYISVQEGRIYRVRPRPLPAG